MLFKLSILKDQTIVGLISGCSFLRALQTQNHSPLNACRSSRLELCKNSSKDTGNSTQVSSNINCKLHQPVLGDPSREGPASDRCTQTQSSCTSASSCSFLPRSRGGIEKEAELGSSLDSNASHFLLGSPRIKYGIEGA